MLSEAFNSIKMQARFQIFAGVCFKEFRYLSVSIVSYEMRKFLAFDIYKRIIPSSGNKNMSIYS